MPLYLYNFFHLNLAYSAIEEESRPKVIERCYWPLLRLARRRGLPFGIELSGYTLESIADIDPAWVAEFRSLVGEGICELIGCGYAQIIGPLVPAEVTAANLRIGHQVYERLLGCRPCIALLNEQAYSAGMVPLYQEAGYEAIIMEWDNPARAHPDWDPQWSYLPQRACGTSGEQISLIWNKSIAFQKFQRYVHGEMDLDELLSYVHAHHSEQVRALPLYGNDVEIFDFRPGRYMTEAPLHEDGEWERIDHLYATLQEDSRLELIAPSNVLRMMDEPGAGQLLRLESAAQPVPVKKQGKYNLVRWAVSGRDDLNINTRCWQIFAAMNESKSAREGDWRELCYLWSSDFRTHITQSRWDRYQARLDRACELWGTNDLSSDCMAQDGEFCNLHLVGLQGRLDEWTRVKGTALRIMRRSRFLEIEGERLRIRLNCMRGLALDSFVDRTVSEMALCGTLHHGYFNDIRWGADYYSGHVVFESPGRHKITDLHPVEPEIFACKGGLCVEASVSTPLGRIGKRWFIDDATGRVVQTLRFNWPEPVMGSLRLGHMTMIGKPKDKSSLRYYGCRNGGEALECFALTDDAEVSHGDAVSFLISANHAVGMSDGVILLGEANKQLQLRIDKAQTAMIGLVTHQCVRDDYLTRVVLSARELDDTSRITPIGYLEVEWVLKAKKCSSLFQVGKPKLSLPLIR